jgi:hypothetical protein
MKNNFNKETRGKIDLKKRQKEIDDLLINNNCFMDWEPNNEGHLFVLTFNDERPKIEKQFGKTPGNIYKKVHLFYDFIEEKFS